jgi:hypothetical protein
MAVKQDPTHPTGVSSTETRESGEVYRARNRKANAALQLRASGADWDQVAEVLGYPSGHAALVATEKALEKELRTESKELLVKMADKRLELVLRGVMTKALDPEHPEHLIAAGRAREFIADHRKLFGLDKPTEIAMYSPTQSEIEAWVATKLPQDMTLEEDDIFEAEWSEGEPKALGA